MSDYVNRDDVKRAVSRWDMQDLYLPVHFLDLIDEIPAVSVPQWQTANTPPDSERNIFICYGNPVFRSVCVGHYDHEMERFYEDRNFFAKPIYDAMYWCDMPRLPDMEG